MASFVTVAGGSKVAAITPRYRQFVNLDTSPLPGYFQQDSYHMVVDTDIHQGESWQLACAIAHLLYNNNRLGNGDVHAGDTVIVASGEVETGSAQVKMVSHLAQKCLHAQKQIAHWQQLHCRLSFFVPEGNYKQPLPDVTFHLSPISSMDEVESALVAQGLLPSNVLVEAGHFFGDAKSIKQPFNLKHSLQRFSKALPKIANAPGLASPVASHVNNKRLLNRIIIALTLLITLIALWWSIQWVREWMQTPAILHKYQVKTFDTCDNRQPFVLAYPYAKVTKLGALKLDELCAMTITFMHFERPPKTLWLIADSYARLRLNQQPADSDDELVWEIPLPSWQETSREYTLMAFETPLDASDEQSMDAYLLQLYQQKQDVNAELLTAWTDKQGLRAVFILHTLK